jgi:hypothetical protein
MDITLPAFTPIEESLFLTLCGRALDYRSARPFLGDAMADEIVRKLDYDCDRFRLSASPVINIALRAKKLDEVALGFVARHPDAVALDLGAGLDTRMFRIVPPATAWGFPSRRAVDEGGCGSVHESLLHPPTAIRPRSSSSRACWMPSVYSGRYENVSFGLVHRPRLATIADYGPELKRLGLDHDLPSLRPGFG